MDVLLERRRLRHRLNSNLDERELIPGCRAIVRPGKYFQSFRTGDEGFVLSINKAAGTCEVRFDGDQEVVTVASRHLRWLAPETESPTWRRQLRSEEQEFRQGSFDDEGIMQMSPSRSQGSCSPKGRVIIRPSWAPSARAADDEQSLKRRPSARFKPLVRPQEPEKNLGEANRGFHDKIVDQNGSEHEDYRSLSWRTASPAAPAVPLTWRGPVVGDAVQSPRFLPSTPRLMVQPQEVHPQEDAAVYALEGCVRAIQMSLDFIRSMCVETTVHVGGPTKALLISEDAAWQSILHALQDAATHGAVLLQGAAEGIHSGIVPHEIPLPGHEILHSGRDDMYNLPVTLPVESTGRGHPLRSVSARPDLQIMPPATAVRSAPARTRSVGMPRSVSVPVLIAPCRTNSSNSNTPPVSYTPPVSPVSHRFMQPPVFLPTASQMEERHVSREHPALQAAQQQASAGPQLPPFASSLASSAMALPTPPPQSPPAAMAAVQAAQAVQAVVAAQHASAAQAAQAAATQAMHTASTQEGQFPAETSMWQSGGFGALPRSNHVGELPRPPSPSHLQSPSKANQGEHFTHFGNSAGRHQ